MCAAAGTTPVDGQSTGVAAKFPRMRIEKQTRFNIAYVIFAMLAILVVQSVWQRALTTEVVPYSEFEKLLQEKKIAEVSVGERQITGKLRAPEGSKTIVVANLVPPDLAERLN